MYMYMYMYMYIYLGVQQKESATEGDATQRSGRSAAEKHKLGPPKREVSKPTIVLDFPDISICLLVSDRGVFPLTLCTKVEGK